MKVIAKILARGMGSTLHRKNAYPILGKPMMWWFLKEMKRAKFIDEIFVWTEDEELSSITEECGCHVIPRSRNQVFYHAGFGDPDQWQVYINDFVKEKCGTKGDIRIQLNCNYILMTAEILEMMFIRLMEDMFSDSIVAVTKTDPHLYMVNPKTDRLFPIWHEDHLERQEHPDLYRSSAITMIHRSREKRNTKIRRLFHDVSPEYLIDVHDLEDIKLVEYYLMRRYGGCVVMPNDIETRIISRDKNKIETQIIGKS